MTHTVDKYHLEGLDDGSGGLVSIKFPKTSKNSKLLQIASEPDRVLLYRSRNVTNHGYCRIATRVDGHARARDSNFCISGERSGDFTGSRCGEVSADRSPLTR